MTHSISNQTHAVSNQNLAVLSNVQNFIQRIWPQKSIKYIIWAVCVKFMRLTTPSTIPIKSISHLSQTSTAVPPPGPVMSPPRNIHILAYKARPMLMAGICSKISGNYCCIGVAEVVVVRHFCETLH